MEKDFQLMRGDIMWANNINAAGSVQNSMRPYLIISNNDCNQYSPIVTAIPFTTQCFKNNMPTHYNIIINNKVNCALCEQIVCIDKKDIVAYIDTIEDNDLKEIEKRVKIQLDIKE